MKPLRDRAVVKVLMEDAKVGSIIIPENIQEKSQKAEVVEVGSGRVEDGKIIPMEVKKGDKILYDKYNEVEVKIDGEEYSIIKESDILALIN